MQQFDKSKLITKPATSIVMLISLFIFLLVAMGLIVTYLYTVIENEVALLRITAVLQSVLVFITPAVAVAMLSTRYPASLLAIDKLPSWKMVLTSVCTLIVSIPLMNVVIELNQSITFPESMSGIEKIFREVETSSEESFKILFQGNNVATLLMNITVIGIFAGLGEEIFFRGGLMRLFGCVKNISPHTAIWVTAIIFSALHLQFFGFIPRMLFGAFFGYLVYWSGSLWLPILIHILNNSIVVIFCWINSTYSTDININAIGTISSVTDIVVCIASMIFTILLIYILRRQAENSQSKK